jgi:TRAP-type C4-dicarboxylate transport system substrate-binding protein
MANRGSDMKSSKWAVVLLIVILAVSLSVVLAACGDDTATTTDTESAAAVEDTGQTWDLKFSYPTPERASLVGAYLVPWTAEITAVTDDRVKITHYAENSLVKEEQQWDAVLSGTSDMALIEPEFNPGTFPISEVGSLPYQFPDAVTAAKTYWDVVTQKAQDEWKDVQVLAVTVIAPAQYRGNVQVDGDVAKFDGMRLRSGGRIETWVAEALGATPVEISTGDLATSLERGLADGALLSYSLILAQAKDFTKYTTQCDMMYRCWVLVMNKDVWESMPTAVQDQIMGVSGQEGSANYSKANEMEGIGEMKGLEGADKGMGNPPIYVLSEDELAQWKTAVEPVSQKWVEELGADANGQEVLDFIAAQNATYAGSAE